MSITLTFPIVPQLSGWSLPGTVRGIKDANGNFVRHELAPQSPFAGYPEFDNSDLSAWSIANNGHLAVVDANTTQKDFLYLAANADDVQMESGNHIATRYYQAITGDFDVYSRIQFGNDIGIQGVWLSAFATDGSENWFAGALYFNVNKINAISRGVGTGGNTFNTEIDPGKRFGFGYIRVRRSGNTFSGYYSFDGVTWTQQGGSLTLSGMTSSANVGLCITTYNTGATSKGWIDFIRTWPPYDTASPSSSIVIDSGSNGTVWTMSTFQDYLNEYKEYSPQYQIGFGTLAYQYGAGDNSPPALNGSWLSTASMQGQSNPMGRYFKLAVQFNSANGYQLADFNGATIQGAISGGGGGKIIGSSIIGSGVLV